MAAGVDRSRGRWVWAALEHAVVDWGVAASIGEVRQLTGTDTWMGVDMPIGFADPPSIGRRCEQAARALLGARRSSVFPTLPRACYVAPYEERDAIVEQLGLVRSYSKQAWQLRDGIFDVAEHLDPRMFETHPELAFACRARRALDSKKSPGGSAQRRAILEGEGVEVPHTAELSGVPLDDILDAAICAVVARARAGGRARFVPADADPAREPVIWY
jgi:predicted RNase H-like nuclease